ncbi:MAG: hypothetical protein ACTSXQ_03965 [Alphaproteobacteria bacterium]
MGDLYTGLTGFAKKTDEIQCTKNYWEIAYKGPLLLSTGKKEYIASIEAFSIKPSVELNKAYQLLDFKLNKEGACFLRVSSIHDTPKKIVTLLIPAEKKDEIFSLSLDRTEIRALNPIPSLRDVLGDAAAQKSFKEDVEKVLNDLAVLHEIVITDYPDIGSVDEKNTHIEKLLKKKLAKMQGAEEIEKGGDASHGSFSIESAKKDKRPAWKRLFKNK